MAFMYEESFRVSQQVRTDQPYYAADMDYLRKTMIAILDRISGAPVVTSEGRLYTKPPRNLSTQRDGLKPKWKSIWEDTIIIFDAEEYGATAHLKDYVVTFGSFFTKPQPERIIEKVLWHELLHIYVDLPKQMHHGSINRIITRGLKVPGDPNPLGTVGLAC